MSDRITANTAEDETGSRPIGRPRAGDFRLGGCAARGFGGSGAGSLGRRFRWTARLVAGDGAGPEDRSGAAVDRRADRGVRDRDGNSAGRSDRGAHDGAGALRRLVGHGGDPGLAALAVIAAGRHARGPGGGRRSGCDDPAAGRRHRPEPAAAGSPHSAPPHRCCRTQPATSHRPSAPRGRHARGSPDQ